MWPSPRRQTVEREEIELAGVGTHADCLRHSEVDHQAFSRLEDDGAFFGPFEQGARSARRGRNVLFVQGQHQRSCASDAVRLDADPLFGVHADGEGRVGDQGSNRLK